MHSSLPQQLANFKFSRSRVLRWGFEVFERLAVRRSRVVIVICAELERQVREIAPQAAAGADRERPRRRRRAAATAGATRCARSSGSGRRRRWCSTPGTFEAYQGLDLLFDAAQDGAGGTIRTRGSCWPAGAPTRSPRRRARWPRAGLADVVIFAGERPADQIPHFLEAADVLVSPRSRGTNTPLKIYQYLRAGRVDRRHAAAHAHAGADRRGRDPHRADARGVWRRHPRGAGRPRARCRASAARAGELAETQVQLRGVSDRTREAVVAPDRARRDAAGHRRRGLSQAPGPRPRTPSRTAGPLQLHRLRRPGHGRSVRSRALQRADRRAAGRDAGRRAARLRRRRRRRRRCSTSARAPAGRRWCWPRPGARVTAVDASGRDAARGRSAGRRARGSGHRVRDWRRASPGVRRPGRLTRW